MPKKISEGLPSPSPELHFQPPPRRSYDNFTGLDEGCSEPRRSEESPHPRLSSKKSSAAPRNPAPKRSPTQKTEGRPAAVVNENKVKVKKKGTGLAQKHSFEDLKEQVDAEDLAAPFRDGDEEARRARAGLRKVAAKAKLTKLEKSHEDLATLAHDTLPRAQGTGLQPKPAPIRAAPAQRVPRPTKATASQPAKAGRSAPVPSEGSTRSADRHGSSTDEEQQVTENPQKQLPKHLQMEVLQAISILPEDTSVGSGPFSVSSQVTANFPDKSFSPARAAQKISKTKKAKGEKAQRPTPWNSVESDEGRSSMVDLPTDGFQEALVEALENGSPEALNAFHAALEEGTQPVQTVKLCFVGHARAGKTSTLNALAGRQFDPEQPSTHGVVSCTFAKELLSAAPSRTTSTTGDQDVAPSSQPWLEMEGEGSVAKLLEEKVAMTIADNMKATAQLDRGSRRSTRAGSEESSHGVGPSVVKMPVDLIIQAISDVNRADAKPQKDVIMQTWDFAGQQMYYNMAHVFLTSFGIYALVLDISTWADGEALSPALESMDFWLAALLVHAPDAWLVIVGSHADRLEDSKRLQVYQDINEVLVERLQQAHQHAKVLGNEAGGLLFFPVDNRGESDESIRGIAHLREALNSLALDVAKALEVIPTRWAHFFHDLEGQNDVPYIEIGHCRAQAAAMGINETDLELFLGLFHQLGQLLYFKESPAVVLSPQWLLDAMAQVVGCPIALERCPLQAQALHKRGDLSDQLLEVLWRDKRFQGHKEVLQAFLEHFDLLVPGSDKAGWLVPSLLPRRPPTTPRCDAEVVFVLDFKGAFKRLLPTLIPRLLCQLRKHYGTDLEVLEAYGDFAQLWLGSPPVLVTFDMHPAEAPEVLRVEVTSADRSTSPNLEELLDSLHAALEAWLPHVSYDTKLPCPCGAAVSSQGGHLLDLSDVLANVPIFCRQSAGLIRASELPEAIQAWRERPAGASRTTAAAERPFMYMYSSPLHTRLRQFPQLNVHKEFETLQGLLGGCTTQVATYTTLENALQMRPAPSVLHLSCHSMPYLRGSSVRQYLLLEDDKGCGHPLDVEGLRHMGGWENLGLLVLLACDSVAIAKELPCRSVCCANKVSDSAVRDFCRSFYLHLFSGQAVEDAFRKGCGALRNHADTGLRAEAERFVLWTPVEQEEPVFMPPRGGDASDGSPWPTTPPVEKYRLQALDLAMLAGRFVDRRVVLLTGPAGAGKTTSCRFFCRFFGAPGRLFAEGVALLGNQEMNLLFEKDGCLQHLLAKTVLDALNVKAWATCAWSTLTSLTRHRRWLLVLDGIDRFQSEQDMERLRKPLEDLLRTCTKLCVVLTSRSLREGGPGRPWELAQLDVHKVVPHPLSPLSQEDACLLFLDRIVRKLYPRDFDLDDLSEVPLQGGSHLVQQLRCSPLMQALAGVPGAIVDAAAWVDCTLPSLLQHPILLRK